MRFIGVSWEFLTMVKMDFENEILTMAFRTNHRKHIFIKDYQVVGKPKVASWLSRKYEYPSSESLPPSHWIFHDGWISNTYEPSTVGSGFPNHGWYSSLMEWPQHVWHVSKWRIHNKMMRYMSFTRKIWVMVEIEWNWDICLDPHKSCHLLMFWNTIQLINTCEYRPWK